MIEALQAPACRPEISWVDDGTDPVDPLELTGRCYVRYAGKPADAEKALGQVRVLAEENGETAVLTAPARVKDLMARAESLGVLALLRVLE